MSTPLLEIRDLRTWFPVRGGVLRAARGQCKAVDGVSLSVWPGETVGLVGESGCGKSTLGKSIVRLVKPTSGQVLFEGTDLASLSSRRLKPFRRQVQMIFQDPADSLNSRHSVGSMLEEPYLIHGIGDEASRRERALELLRIVVDRLAQLRARVADVCGVHEHRGNPGGDHRRRNPQVDCGPRIERSR